MTRLTIAVQKSGRLSDDSLDLLSRCGLSWERKAKTLLAPINELPIDLLFVRADDIPSMITSGVCDLGIAGQNTVREKTLSLSDDNSNNVCVEVMPLGFGQCRLSIAMPDGIKDLDSLCIATSYPFILKDYARSNKLDIEVVQISGSVEVAPSLGMADAICDLVSSGQTLKENNLIESTVIMNSEAVLIQKSNLSSVDKKELVDLLACRIKGVLKAKKSKYILFHAPKKALDSVMSILPGVEVPTILPLPGDGSRVSVQLVSEEGVFWGTLEAIKKLGASSILVLPIEKMMQ